MLVMISFIIFAYMAIWFEIAQIKKDNTVADFAWSLGFILVAWFSLIKSGNYFAPQLLITSMITIWGLRLATHIYLRNKGKGEDPRYKKMRQEWANHVAIRSFLQIFMLQGLLLLIIVYPVILINSSNINNLGLLHFIGLCLWLTGFFFEATGDYQLYAFLKDPNNKGRIMTQGVWQYTRHPNYFGEITMWWGIFIMALAVPFGNTAVISPLLITYLLLFVSGIPMTEKPFENNPEFQEYKKRTSPLIPWFTKK